MIKRMSVSLAAQKHRFCQVFKKKNDWNSVILSAENIDQALLNFSNTFLIHIRECMP